MTRVAQIMISLCMLLFIMVSLRTFADEVVAIKSLYPKTRTISRQEVVWMYTMKTKFWDDGTRITVFYLNSDSFIHKNFVRQVLGMSPTDFDRIVSSSINIGNTGFYRTAESAQDAYNKVNSRVGSISYVNSSTMVINGKGYVRELKISD